MRGAGAPVGPQPGAGPRHEPCRWSPCWATRPRRHPPPATSGVEPLLRAWPRRRCPPHRHATTCCSSASMCVRVAPASASGSRWMLPTSQLAAPHRLPLPTTAAARFSLAALRLRRLHFRRTSSSRSCWRKSQAWRGAPSRRVAGCRASPSSPPLGVGGGAGSSSRSSSNSSRMSTTGTRQRGLDAPHL